MHWAYYTCSKLVTMQRGMNVCTCVCMHGVCMHGAPSRCDPWAVVNALQQLAKLFLNILNPLVTYFREPSDDITLGSGFMECKNITGHRWALETARQKMICMLLLTKER